jgi:protein-S-isoprenylcysteine O-methyltransferase Ste14
VLATRIVLGALLQPAACALLLFYPPGRFAWARAWALVAVVLAATAASQLVLARTAPALLRERMRPPLRRRQPRADAVLVVLFLAAYAAALRFVPIDVFRWRLLPSPPAVLAAAGMALVVAGFAITTAALAANPFASPVVRHQADRGHRVVDAGPYAVVRHPMYAGTALGIVGMPLWLDSTAGVLVALVPLAILAARIALEERLLRRELPGYAAYAARVRFRLVPGLW